MFNVTEFLATARQQGGCTVKLSDGSSPETGYMVARADCEMTVPTRELDAKIVQRYISEYFAYLAEPKAFLGIWLNDGIAYLDVSYVFADKQSAINFARLNSQLAIYNVATGETIDL